MIQVIVSFLGTPNIMINYFVSFWMSFAQLFIEERYLNNHFLGQLTLQQKIQRNIDIDIKTKIIEREKKRVKTQCEYKRRCCVNLTFMIALSLI
jgi:hypothetical protein